MSKSKVSNVPRNPKKREIASFFDIAQKTGGNFRLLILAEMWKWGHYEGILVYAFHSYELIYFTSSFYKTLCK